jgi:hypothetical protein
MKSFERHTFKDNLGTFDYVTVPSKDYGYQTVLEVNDLKLALGEWMTFYHKRFARCNTVSPLETNKVTSVNVPIITRDEMFKFGL